MINYSDYKPRIFPYNGDVAPAEIDRAQAIDPAISLDREKIYELGRLGKVGTKQGTPDVTYRLTQLEYGNFEFWRKITNQLDAVVVVDLDDFKTPMFDICGYLTDDDGTFVGTKHYPRLRTSGFSFGIGDPEANAERGFDFVGDKAVTWTDDNKYFIYNKFTAGSGGDDEIDLSAKAPAIMPDENISGATDAEKYIYRCLRVRSGVTTELIADTDFTYSDSTKKVTITSILASDIIKTYYTSGTAPDTLFTNNDVNPASISADSVVIEIGSGTKVYRLQSVTLDVAFDRADYKEIGNKDVVLRGITDKTVTFTLGRLLEDFTIEEALRGAGANYGQLDVEKLEDNATLTIKIYEDNTLSNFKLGMKATGLSPTDLGGGAAVNEYTNAENTLEGDNLIVTNDENEL